MIERRRAQRVSIATVANVGMGGLRETVKVFVQDLSAVGMGCTTNHLFQKGDMVLVKLELTQATGEVVTESLTGKVARASKNDTGKHDSINTETNYTIGIEFRNVERVYPSYYAYVKGLEKTNI